MRLELVEELLGKHDGNFSVLYPLIKDKIDAMNYECYDLPFPGNFLFFEDRYLTIRKHMIENNINVEEIVDIGCQLGIQSYIFNSLKYVGIDYSPAKFFKYEGCNSSFITGNFNDVDLDLSNSIVISSMSLGFFESDAKDGNKLSELQLMHIEKISKAKHLYIASSSIFSSEVISRFNYCEKLIDDSSFLNYSLYYLTNKDLG